MPFSIRLTERESAILEAAAKRTARTKSQLVRESIRDYCLRLAGGGRSAFALGSGLFGAGALAKAPRHPGKRAVWEKLRAKHQRVG